MTFGRFGGKSGRDKASVFGWLPGRVISLHGSAAMSSAVLSYDVDRDTAQAIGHRFIATLQSEIRAGGHSREIGASIGAALIPDDGTTAEEIIHNTDLAMYRAKGQDGPSLIFSEPTASHPRQIA